MIFTNTKLYVGNLSYDCTSDLLAQHFGQAGAVVSAQVITDKMTGRSRGFGFVEMADAKAAEEAIKMLNGQDFMGRKLVVSEARPPRENNGGFGGR